MCTEWVALISANDSNTFVLSSESFVPLSPNVCRIYQLQDDGQTYATPADMLRAMGGDHFVELAHTPLQKSLRHQGFSDRFIDEVASVAMRDNYGQSTNITAFAGMPLMIATYDL